MGSYGTKLHLLSLIAALAAIHCSGGDSSDDSNPNDASCRSPAVTVAPDPSCSANYTAIIRGEAVDQAGNDIDSVLAQMCIDEGSDNPKCLRPIATCEPGYLEIPLDAVDRCLVSAVVHMIPEAEGD